MYFNISYNITFLGFEKQTLIRSDNQQGHKDAIYVAVASNYSGLDLKVASSNY